MTKFIYLFIIAFSALSCQSQTKEKSYKIEKTASEWKDQLTVEQYHILREAGTERPFTSEYNKNKKKGTYVCAACKNPLYESNHKFDSGTGWPSFDRAIKGSITIGVDYNLGYARNELKCADCGGHLGHVFGDGPKTTGKRHCINGVALNFENQHE